MRNDGRLRRLANYRLERSGQRERHPHPGPRQRRLANSAHATDEAVGGLTPKDLKPRPNAKNPPVMNPPGHHFGCSDRTFFNLAAVVFDSQRDYRVTLP